MALWFKKDRNDKRTERELSFNVKLLKEQMENLSSKLYTTKSELSFLIISEVIELAKNVQLLEVNRASKSQEEFWIHKGRLQAFSDLSGYLERAATNQPKREGEGKTRDTLRVRPVNNQAGAAI